MINKFKTAYNFKDIYVTCPGSKTIDPLKKKATGEEFLETKYEYNYKVHYDSKGDRHLVISGRTNVYDKIQSYKEDVDIYKILEKYTNGDISVLDKNKGFYVDCTKIPKDYNEYHNRIAEGQRIFDSLPIDFKETFGKNVNQFMNSIYDKSFEKRYKDYVDVKNNNRLHNSNVVNNMVLDNGQNGQGAKDLKKGDSDNDK